MSWHRLQSSPERPTVVTQGHRDSVTGTAHPHSVTALHATTRGITRSQCWVVARPIRTCASACMSNTLPPTIKKRCAQPVPAPKTPPRKRPMPTTHETASHVLNCCENGARIEPDGAGTLHCIHERPTHAYGQTNSLPVTKSSNQQLTLEMNTTKSRNKIENKNIQSCCHTLHDICL